MEELGRYVKRHIDVYFKTFPEEVKKTIQAHEINRDESGTEWKYEKLNISVPAKG